MSFVQKSYVGDGWICSLHRQGGRCMALGSPAAPEALMQRAPQARSSPLPLCKGTACGEPSVGQNVSKLLIIPSAHKGVSFMIIALYIS